MKTALITGADGQDGSYLARLLVEKNYRVICSVRSLNSGFERLSYLNLLDKVKVMEGNLLEKNTIDNFFNQIGKIDQIYNFAAISYVPSSFIAPNITFETNTIPVLNFLEKIKSHSPKTRFYQASTSEMYGNEKLKSKKNEMSPMIPVSPYGSSKLASHNLVKIYRESYNIFCCSGILFNHESPLRGHNFVTKKIVKSLVRFVKNQVRENKLGNIYAKRDWGYAPDYVDGINKIIENDFPTDFVLATGKTYSIKQFLEYCLNYLQIKYEWVKKNKKLVCREVKSKKIIFYTDQSENMRPNELHTLIGDSSKASKVLKWKPKTSIKDLIKIMIDEEFIINK